MSRYITFDESSMVKTSSSQ